MINFWSRIQPGDEMPAGDCPAYGAFVYINKEESK